VSTYSCPAPPWQHPSKCRQQKPLPYSSRLQVGRSPKRAESQPTFLHLNTPLPSHNNIYQPSSNFSNLHIQRPLFTPTRPPASQQPPAPSLSTHLHSSVTFVGPGPYPTYILQSTSKATPDHESCAAWYFCLSWMVTTRPFPVCLTHHSITGLSEFSDVIGSYVGGCGISFQLWSVPPLSCSSASVLAVNTHLAVPRCLEPFEPCQDRRCIVSRHLARCSG
jgi:hypothetical protein